MNPNLILISGAGNDLGYNLSSTLLAKGYSLILLDLEEEVLSERFKANTNLNLLSGDISKAQTWLQAIEIAKSLGQPISHLINCPRKIRPGFISDFELSEIDFHLTGQVKETILGTTIIGREMKFQEFGHIINIASLAGIAPVSGLGLHSTSMFAVRGFTLAAASEFRDFGVDISVVCPDLEGAPMFDSNLGDPRDLKLSFNRSKKGLSPDEITQVIIKLMENPVPQVCIPESGGFFAKVAGAWPSVGEWLKKTSEN